MRRRRAFTLIELLIVVALTAVMATIAAVSLAGSHRAARAEDVAEQIATFDRLAREHARRFGKTNDLVFDLGRGTVTRTGQSADASSTLSLPSGFRIGRLLTPKDETTSGEVALPGSIDGHRPTYAIQLMDSAGMSHWRLTLGLTGKSMDLKDEREALDIFRTLRGESGTTPAPAGDDAR